MNPVEEDRALDGEDVRGLRDVRGREAMDPMTRHLVWIASGIALLLVVVIGGWTLGSRHPATIPVVEAPPGPVRLKPIDPGGMQATGAQALPPVMPEDAGHQSLAPQPEAARPDELKAEVDAARGGEAGQPPGMAAGHGGVQAAPPAPAPAAVPPPQDPAQDNGEPQKPRQVPAGPLLHTEATPAPPTASAPRGRLTVQLAALNSDAAALTEWSRLCRSHPLLFSGRKPLIQQADHDGRPIYRLRTRGFATVAAAASFCEQAHAQRVACTVADF